MINFFKKKAKQVVVHQENPQDTTVEHKDTTEQEIAAAIALALDMYMCEQHEYEKMVLTIQRVMRPYSPWSSKIYGLRQYPRK